MASVLGLVETSGAVKLQDVPQHRVTTKSLSTFNVNGTIRKAQKSKPQEKLTMTAIPEPNVYTSTINICLLYTSDAADE